MQLTYTGNNPRFLEQSFFDGNGALAVNITSQSPTEVVLTHTVFTQANVSVTLNGLGFAVDQSGLFTSGQITSMEFDGLNIRQGTVSDINWSIVDFQNALIDTGISADVSGLADLLSSSGRITLDVSAGLTGYDQEEEWNSFLPLLTEPITFIGSPFDDQIAGTVGNDVINTGGNDQNGDRIVGSLGNDVIVFDRPETGTNPGYFLDYDAITEAMAFDIDGVTNAGTATGSGFTDRFDNVNDALGAYLGVEGTAGDDTYTVRLGQDQVFAFIGGAGTDSYALTGDGGRPILDFFFNNVSSGIDVNLATSTIANDGFGTSDTLDIQGEPDRLIILSTDLNDTVTDGTGDQLVRFYNGDDTFFASNLGNDSIDGGNGQDIVVFNSVSQGQMTLTFDGALTRAVDRGNAANSTTLLGVETIQTEGNVQLNLSQHDGIGLISAEDLTDLAELYIAYFDRAADALGLSFWATAFQNGFTLREIADLFFEQIETQSLYSDVSDGAFVQAVYNNVLGRDADQLGFEFWTGQLAAGNVTESSFILELLAGARAPTGDPDDVAFIEDKTDIGLYFAVIQGQNSLADARNVMDTYYGTIFSFFNATNASDAALANAQNSDTALLMPVVGVIDTESLGIV